MAERGSLYETGTEVRNMLQIKGSVTKLDLDALKK